MADLLLLIGVPEHAAPPLLGRRVALQRTQRVPVARPGLCTPRRLTRLRVAASVAAGD